ncbi:RagB/SusD family nutrient uptake outer membrane protein [Parabacteroides sp.]
MKCNIILRSIIGFLLMGMVSCAELTENPEGVLTPNNFYTTIQQCESALVGSIGALINTWGGYNNGTPPWPDGQQPGSLGFSPTSYTDHWAWHYKAINNINPVIKSIKDGRLSTENKTDVDNVLGQAYFLRAFNYFWLVQLYGKLPYIDENTSDLITNALTPESRLEIAVIYDKIVDDLENASQLMGDYNASTPAKPNKWVAKGLLSKVYLTMATAPLYQTDKFEKARDLADDVINNSPYKLLPIIDIFNTSNPNNPEFLFAFQYTDDYPAMPGEAWGPETEWATWGGGKVRTVWAEKYPEQPRKNYYLRTYWPVNLKDDPSDWKWVHYPESIDQIPWDGKKIWPNLTIAQQAYGENSKVLLPILRISEMYLIYAEAANMANNGPTQLAVDRLNLIIDRANKPFESAIAQTSIEGTEEKATINMSKEEFDTKVFEERDWELCFEFTKYFDVLRKKVLQEVNEPDAYNFVETDYLFPIPPYDATFIGNNPGYN